jgi:hypothetical protein
MQPRSPSRSASGWERLGGIAPRALRAAREQAHWAVQVVAAAGESFLPHAPDTSHTATTWDAGLAGLVGGALPGPASGRLGLQLADLALCRLGPDGAVWDRLALAGQRLADAYRWAADALRRESGGAQGRPLTHPGFALPEHAIGSGGRFARDAGLPELARWYANADLALRAVARETRGAGPVLCWPHHFDLATLVELAPGAARTVGVGMSPGDAGIDEPYFYVNHSPATSSTALPALAAGQWWTQGWLGAVLRGSELVAAGDGAAQQGLLHAFLASAVPASRALALESPGPQVARD